MTKPNTLHRFPNKTHNQIQAIAQFKALSEIMLTTLQKDIETVLKHANMPSPLRDACAYAIQGNGKRVRPLLVAASYQTVMKTTTNAQVDILFLNDACRRAMLAVELLHTYSLIHDDLPCMDDDDLRRGRATCHIKFDEATALLAGDVLQTLAFEVLTADIADFEPVSVTQSIDTLKVFTPRARRMVMGQMLDINAENKTVQQDALEAIHRDKTGALIEAATLMGGLCALTEADENSDKQSQLLALQEFATNIGLAFQVQDDILDVISNTQDLGKPAGSDEALNKSTYVKLMGVDDAQNYAQTLFSSANNAIAQTFGNYTYLHGLADWLWTRQK